ncbi:hypothetical protein EJB05_44718, partial [Eragrostis curvula]
MASASKEVPPLTHAENEEFLRMLRDARQRLGHEAPEVEILFDGITVEAEIRVNGARVIADSMHMCATRRKTFKIIDGLSGTIRPSRMTLVLGAPGSGKTTFLKALAGKLDSSLKILLTEICPAIVPGKGNIQWGTKLLRTQYLCAYVSQQDLHHAEMTVRETINFASNMLGANNEFGTTHYIFQATKFGEGSNLKTNYIIKVTSKMDQQQYWAGDQSEYQSIPLKNLWSASKYIMSMNL